MMKWAKGSGGLTGGRRLHNSAREIWVNTLSECSTTHMAMLAVTGLDGKSSDQVELGIRKGADEERWVRSAESY